MNVNYFECPFHDADLRESGEWSYECRHPLNKYGGQCLLENKFCGMSLRDYLAAKAMQGILANPQSMALPPLEPASYCGSCGGRREDIRGTPKGGQDVMARNMSFMLTKQQIRDRTKTVTRRLGWTFLAAGDKVNAVAKTRGLKPGEKVQQIARLRVASVRRERLKDITQEDVVREGFTHLDREGFIKMFMEHMHQRDPQVMVTRIEFEYLD